jgi:hypothetical protein
MVGFLEAFLDQVDGSADYGSDRVLDTTDH